MINLSSSHYYNNVSFTANEKNNTSTQKPVNQPKHNNGVSKATTGILTTSAFLAGLGVNNMIQESNAKEFNPVPITAEYTPTSNRMTISPFEAPQQDTNRGPSSAKRYWTTTEEQNINGKTYIIKNKYTVKEVALHTDEIFIDKATNTVEQTLKKDGYKLFPTSEIVKDKNGGLVSSKKYNGFNKSYLCPESAEFKELMTDGSYDITNINYIVDIKFSNTKDNKPPKTEPKPEKKPGKEVLGSWLDYME